MSEALAAQLPALALAIMLLAAPIAFLANARGARVVSLVAGGMELVVAFWMAFVVATDGPLLYRIGGWGAPLGIDYRVDGLAATMIALAAVVGFCVTAYAAAYFGPDEKYRHYWPLWLFLWGSLVALFSSNDAFNLYVCLELVSISAVALVAIGGSRSALGAAMRYMFAAIAGSLFYLLGVALVYGGTGALDLTILARVVDVPLSARIGLGLMVIGLLVKTALVPMHFWLPPAHANAVSPVSAVLSALVVKGSFYIVLRLMTALDGGDAVSGLPLMLGLMGSAAIVWGSVQALLQTRLKMLVAYSTVAQIGYLFILFPLVQAASEPAQAATAISAGVFHAVSHGLAKTAMFLVAGAVLTTLGHDRIADLTGLARRLPAQAFAFGLAGISMLGLPPSGGFVSKWLYVSSALSSGAWWWAIPVLGGGLLAATYVFRVIAIFLRAPNEEPAPPADGEIAAASGAAISWVPLTLALASLLVGVLGQPVLDLIGPAALTMVAGVAS
jgi:formate hydrogenlyase subunit 3/multisubunit Na+/H+ antiporter MnhD subunit